MPRTCASEVPLAITRQSVTSETPRTSSTRTSLAFASRQSWAARTASWTDAAGADCDMWSVWCWKRGAGAPHNRRARPRAGPRGPSAARYIGDRRAEEARGTGARLRSPVTAHRASAAPRLLLDDPDLDLGAHVGVQAHRHAVDAERLERLVQVDLALLDVEALRLELLRDVGRRHGAEQLALVADAGGEGDRHLLELLRDLLGAGAALGLGGLEARLLERDALLVPLGRREGDAARQEVVAGEAGADGHDVAGVPQVVHGLPEDDFH